MLVDDHEVVRRGVATAVGASSELSIVGEAAGVAEAVRRLPAIRPDVLVVDLQLPDGTGIDVMRKARELNPEQLMLVLTSFDDEPAMRESKAVGAAGMMLKSSRSRDIVDAILTVHGGEEIWPADHKPSGPELSENDQRIVELIGDGHSNREIAEDVVAVVRESLANAARHAHASAVAVAVSVFSEGVDRVIQVSVSDNGRGIDPSVTRRSGLANMSSRARRHSGWVDAIGLEPGTMINWRVTLPPR
jgi:DNA-binding NarL/FixJ family response regulator